MDLRQLVQPIEPERFFQEYWERSYLVIRRGDAQYFSELLSMRDVDYIVTSTDARYPGIRLVKDGVELPTRSYTSDIDWGTDAFFDAADVDRVMHYYDQGATIVLQALNRSWHPIAVLCRDLEAHLNHPVQANAYLTPKRSQGFAPHYDTHDVFVLQVCGFKHWRMYDSPILLPSRNQPFDSSKVKVASPTEEFDLGPGDVIYIPRGWIHEALTSDNESLHITIGIKCYTWFDLLSEMVSLSQQHVEIRRSLPVGFLNSKWIDDSARRSFRLLAERILEATTLDSVVESVGRRFVLNRSPILKGQLAELNNADNLTLDSRIQPRKGVVCRIVGDSESVSVLFHGKRVRFPAYVGDALSFVVGASQFPVSAIPNVIDDEGKLVLVRRLLREGLLSAVR